MRIMSRSVSAKSTGTGTGYGPDRRLILPDRGAGGTPLFSPARGITVAHFVQRYPPAIGGSEAYVERLSRYLADHGDTVRVWTTTAVELEELWRPGRRCDGWGRPSPAAGRLS